MEAETLAIVVSIVVAVIGLNGFILKVLFSHEERLTRIEGKIDLIIRFLNKENKS